MRERWHAAHCRLAAHPPKECGRLETTLTSPFLRINWGNALFMSYYRTIHAPDEAMLIFVVPNARQLALIAGHAV